MRLGVAVLSGLLLQCNTILSLFGQGEEESPNLTALAALLLASQSSSSGSSNPCTSSVSTGSTISNSTATVGGDGCISGVTTSMDSSLPGWIKDNFKCSVGYVVGDYYCFKSKNLPNHASYYWGNGANLYAALPNLDGTQHTAAGTNRIASQNFVYAIPKNPTVQNGTKSGTQAGLSSIGITRNGLAIFNNAAAPGDTLATEATTFDAFGSHPQSSGVTHHHAWVKQYSTDQSGTATTQYNNDVLLIGLALDGYAIYGSRCDNGTAGTGDDFTPTLDTYHGHTAVTQHFSTATYHYHYVYDSTATIKTLMGSSFYGTIGTVTN
ncbi:MAG: YHYH protein [Spirochaetales bacterium]|nr:YHYH protein [Spirochaetales bacterium]